MKIGFDAKRAFYNSTGLGSYSRTVLQVLSRFYPQNQYVLFSPRSRKPPKFNLHLHYPTVWSQQRFFCFMWRTKGLVKSEEFSSLDLFHGLSGQIPMAKSSVPYVVTIHDLIFLVYPEFYNPIDVKIYKFKSQYAVNNSQIVISISQSTKNDILRFFKIPEEKIKVVYQSYNPIFSRKCTYEEKLRVRSKYNLPGQFILYVGTIEPRKNALRILNAMEKYSIDFPIVLIGRFKPAYKKKIFDFLRSAKIKNRVFFVNNVKFKDLPAIYQQALYFVYPSLYEGFGIPVIEAQRSGLPVITSNVSSLPEAGGPHSILVDPFDVEQLGYAMLNLLNDGQLRRNMAEKGKIYVQKFSEKNFADNLMDVYRQVVTELN